MKRPNQPTPAEIADRHRRYMALALLVVGLIFLSRAVLYLASDGYTISADLIQSSMAIITLLLISPILLWKIRHRSPSERIVYFSKDGYAAQALIFAQKRSWAITFVLLAFLEGLAEVLSRYPTELVLQFVLAVMLGSVSLLFLYKTRPTGELEFDGGEAPHA